MDSKRVLPTSIRTNVLSIQSHVVHGCVGNSAATFPMQINGVDVDTFNILSFSNHTGYPLFKGYRITPEQFRSIADGLVQNGFTKKYDFVLSGYIGNAPVMEELGAFIEKICQESRGANAANLVYVCDPVCGDLGKLYVSEECVDIYRKVLLPLATIALPNGFEASIISGVEVHSIESAVLASEWFHTVAKVPIVVIKSFSDVGRDPQHQSIFMLVSEVVADEETIDKEGVRDNGESLPTKSDENGGRRRRHIIEVEYITGYFTGTGDTFGGLFMAHFTKARHSSDETMKKKSVVECVAMAASATLGVLKRTREIRSFPSSSSSAASSSEEEKKVIFSELRGEGESDDFQERELMIIHSADILVREDIHVTVRPL